MILVDDGLATGSTMEAAVLGLRRLNPARIVVAAPVGARETCERLRNIADEVVCLHTPERFEACRSVVQRLQSDERRGECDACSPPLTAGANLSPRISVPRTFS